MAAHLVVVLALHAVGGPLIAASLHIRKVVRKSQKDVSRARKKPLGTKGSFSVQLVNSSEPFVKTL